MATYSFYAYSSRVLTYNASTNAFELAPGFDPATDRILITITDDDRFLDGDLSADEIGEDRNQRAVISTPDGTVLGRGLVYSESYADVAGPRGETIWLDRIEIGGVHYGYVASATLVPGTSYPVSFIEDVDDDLDGRGYDNRLTYDQIVSVPCFVSGTHITTDRGEMPVERIAPGTRVLTRDHAFQEVLWAGRTTVPRARLAADPHLRPVRIAPGSLGPGTPRKALFVSRQHRVLLHGPICDLLFGEAEVFAAAGHLAGGKSGFAVMPAGSDVTYHHILLPRHEVILSEGAWTESFLAAAGGLAAVGEDAMREVRGILGTRVGQVVARRCLRQWEVDALRDGIGAGAVRADNAA